MTFYQDNDMELWSDQVEDFIEYPHEFLDVSKVLEFGAKKYSPNGWLQPGSFPRDKNIESMQRHLNEHIQGITSDHETKLDPLLHLATRALMMYTLQKRAEESNEREDN